MVADVADHFVMRWRRGHRRDARHSRFIGAGRGGYGAGRAHRARGDLRRVADGDFRVLETYLRTLRDVHRFIYLENRFLWSPEIVDALCRKLRDAPHHDFRLVALLPAKPNNGQDDTRGPLAVLTAADDRAARLLAVTVPSATALGPTRSMLTPRSRSSMTTG